MSNEKKIIEMKYDGEFIAKFGENESMGEVVGAGYLPTIEIKKQGITKAYDPISYLVNQRRVFLDGEIGPGMAQIINSQLLMLAHQDPVKPIDLYINSPGGSVTEGMAIFDTMRYITCPVNTIGMGMCASMGSFLLSAGTITGKAYVLPDTTVMVHQVLSGYQGQSTDIDIHGDFTASLKAKLNAYYVKFIAKTKDIDLNNPKNAEKIEEIIDFVDREWERDWFLSAEQAVEFGLVNGIIHNKETKETTEEISSIINKFEEKRNLRKIRGLNIKK